MVVKASADHNVNGPESTDLSVEGAVPSVYALQPTKASHERNIETPRTASLESILSPSTSLGEKNKKTCGVIFVNGAHTPRV
mmetsp:Transcript_96176/g.151495  ORF Transcript_96176/g.151495 Transcript_96176/m.151495 type:complete len:82 (-) Transcript_96176:18-263(-)